MSAIKAVRATITLGDIDLDVYQLPNGKYFLSLTQIAETLSVKHSRLAQFRELDLAQTLYPQGFADDGFVRIDGTTKNVKIISLDDVSKYWTIAAFQNKNLQAIALLAASQTEALERRADTAFNIIRSEEERNQRFIARKDGILQRHFWTDCIKWWLDNNPQVSENTRKFIYPQVSDRLNRALFGMSAAQIRLELDMSPKENIRDCINPLLIPDITFLEKYAGIRVKQGLPPLQALEEAIVMANFPIRHPARA